MADLLTPVAPSAPELNAKPRKVKQGLRPRLSIPLTEDGSAVALDAMTEKVREKYLQVLASSPAAAPATAPAPVVDEGFTPELTEKLFDGVISPALVAWAQRAGYPAEIAAAAMPVSVEEKNALVPMSCRLLVKWLPGGLSRWGDEFAFALTAVMLFNAKVEFMRKMTAAQPRDNVTAFPQAQNTAASQ